MEINEWIQMGILLVAVIAIVFSLWQDNRQRRFRFFIEYTRRYQELVIYTPINLEELTLNHEKVKTCMRLYFDLCSEEFYMHSHGVIKNDVWNLWVDGMRISMHHPTYKAAWELFKSQYDSKEFIHFMNKLASGEA